MHEAFILENSIIIFFETLSYVQCYLFWGDISWNQALSWNIYFIVMWGWSHSWPGHAPAYLANQNSFKELFKHY